MILDFVPDNNNQGTYTGVPELRSPHTLDRSIDAPSVIVANTIDVVTSCLRRMHQVRAIILMTNDGIAGNHDQYDGIPIIIGQQMRLPPDVTYYSGVIEVQDKKRIWSCNNQIVLRGNDRFLTPQTVAQMSPYKLRIPPNIDISDLGSSLDARREVLGSLGMPRKIRIDHTGKITVNPK